MFGPSVSAPGVHQRRQPKARGQKPEEKRESQPGRNRGDERGLVRHAEILTSGLPQRLPRLSRSRWERKPRRRYFRYRSASTRQK